jgi:hypothetical protein
MTTTRAAGVRRFDLLVFVLLVLSGILGAAVVRLTRRVETRSFHPLLERPDAPRVEPVVVRRT